MPIFTFISFCAPQTQSQISWYIIQYLSTSRIKNQAVVLYLFWFTQVEVLASYNYAWALLGYITRLAFRRGSLEKSQNSQKLEPAKISCHKVVENFRISPWKTSEIFRNDRESSESGRELLDILKITLPFLEPIFVSFWIQFTVTENFLLLVLKCLKLQSQKN